MVKVVTSRIDEEQPASPAKKMPGRKYDQKRNEDDGVDYETDLDDFLAAVEGLRDKQQGKKKRLTAVYVEIGDTLIPYFGIKSIERVERYDPDQGIYEYGIVVNADIMAMESSPKTDVSEWWRSEQARDEAWNNLRDQLVELGLTIVSTRE